VQLHKFKLRSIGRGRQRLVGLVTFKLNLTCWLTGMALAGQGSRICCTPKEQPYERLADWDLATLPWPSGCASGWLLREIGAELGFSRDAVRRALLHRGVVMRSGYGSANRSKREALAGLKLLSLVKPELVIRRWLRRPRGRAPSIGGFPYGHRS
jgi:hypothetical protein